MVHVSCMILINGHRKDRGMRQKSGTGVKKEMIDIFKR